ncbi:copper resistance D family protein [Noviherbaspirillum pedocola]|uniref:CopD family protein n=1 Tax=Noviherbaspirillum pedocola TaxID=2801341 RepID=A0A934SZL9_9BURK|nr:CopD family protein [Noviherbaspirillum pedocola]MBK4734648.1 CopD family protein [Noviherbaspirillum pedocola]
MDSTLPQTASTVLINVSLAWVAGVLASRLWLMKHTVAWQKAAVRLLSPAMLAGLVACAVGILLSLWSESSAMGDVPWLSAWPACKEMLTSTHYGHAGVAAAVLLTVAMLAHWALRQSGNGMRYVGSIGVLLLLVFAARVTIGHAFEQGFLSVALLVEWLHLLCMSLWAGIVFVAGWLVVPRMLASELAPSLERAAFLKSMSNWAAAALVGILATGAYNSYRVLASPRDLLDADYGHVLGFKLCFVLVSIALGGFNKFFGLPAALSQTSSAEKANRGLRMVVTVLRIESVALLLVIAAAAVLTNSAPPSA